MRYQVSHRTTYTYDDEVTDSLGIAYLTPRRLPWQDVLSSALAIDPVSSDTSEDVDWYGNTATYFQVTTPHERLRVDAGSVVEVRLPTYDEDALARPWEHALADLSEDADAWRALDLAMPSPLAEHSAAAHAYGARSLLPGRPLAEATAELVGRIHADFTYESGATTVTSTVADVLRKRAGVCQDFAHLALACLRSHGLAARYVSGYLATEPPEGRERLVGVDASHAWVAVRAAGGDWLALDPTNDQRADDRYVTVAWGRDYGDVPPLKGVIFTEATLSTMDVAVDVLPLP